MLSCDDPLPSPAQRIVVAGTSGSGKTTLAGAIARRLDIPHVEIDALFHGPGWTPRPTFEADVEAFIARPAWVTEWQYSMVRDRVADRAELMVWLDLPRAVVMRQVITRTLDRRWHQRVLWNGNIEPGLHTFFTDPQHIVHWAWRTHPRTAQRMAALAARRPELPIVRLTSHAQAAAWLRRLRPTDRDGLPG